MGIAGEAPVVEPVPGCCAPGGELEAGFPHSDAVALVIDFIEHGSEAEGRLLQRAFGLVQLTLQVEAVAEIVKQLAIDGNATTLISALILAQYGTGPIKGFAVTLIIGMLTNIGLVLRLRTALLRANRRLSKLQPAVSPEIVENTDTADTADNKEN